MTIRASKPAFNIREKLKELTQSIGLKGRELMRAATVQEARDLVSAGRKNIIINGDMRVAQRGTSETGVGAAFAYTTVDRIQIRNNGANTARYTNTQSTDAPDNFGHSFKLEVTTAKGTLSSNQYQGVSTRIEGQNLQNLDYGTNSSKYLTLSFWVKSNTTGTYSCHFSNWNASRNISKTYTINSANTWEKKIITIPGDSVAIADDNNLGLEIGWVLATTSFYNDGTDGSVWHNTSDSGKRHAGQVVEFGGTIGDTWQITGVQLEVGKNATEFEYRSYGEELALCQRYFYQWKYPTRDATFLFIRNANTTSFYGPPINFPTVMRKINSVTFVDSSSWKIVAGGSYSITPGAQYNSNVTEVSSFHLYFTWAGSSGSWDITNIRSNENNYALLPKINIEGEL